MRRCFLLLCLASILPASGQSPTPTGEAAALAESKTRVLSPQTADIIRFDRMGSVSASGRLDLTLPVISFPDPDFDLSLAISYNSAGFKPSEQDNYVGRNWSLVGAGTLYREVKGIPDELAALATDGSNDTKGFIHTCRADVLSDERVRNAFEQQKMTELVMTPYQGYAPVIRGNDKYEFSSDIYHFNFGKHAGKFTINFDGSVNVISYDGGKYRVDLSRFPQNSSTGVYEAVIGITTDDGYTYFFGGRIEALEFTALTWTDVFDQSFPVRNQNTFTAFNLTKIVAPNGRELHIDYQGFLAPQYLQNPKELILDREYDALIRDRVNLFFSLTVRPYRYVSLDDVVALNIPHTIRVDGEPKLHYGDVYTLNKISLISGISTDDKRLSFHYSAREATPFENVSRDTRFGQACGARLDSVVLTDPDNRRIEHTQFTYTYPTNGRGRMFLSSMHNSKTGRYAFEYNFKRYLPPMNTTDIDHWGFWRGNSGPQNLIPQVSHMETQPLTNNKYTYTSKDREPSGQAFDVSLLTRIVYPTGGCSEFEYEPHDYSHRLVRNGVWIPTTEMLHDNRIAGGARVKRIDHFREPAAGKKEPAKQTVYRYAFGPGYEQSTGTLLYMPRYVHLSRTSYLPNSVQYFVLKNDSGFNPKEYASDHICYSTIAKFDAESHVERSDSTDYRLIYPAHGDDDVVECDIAVGNLGDYIENGAQKERLYGEWMIWGYGRGGEGAVYILSEDGRTKYFSHKFTGDVSDTLRYKPTELLQPGKYRLILRKKGNGGAGMRWTYPKTSYVKTKGLITETRYTDYLSNPDTFHSRDSQWNNTLSRGSALPVPMLDSLYLRNFFLEPGDRAHERGKVLSRKYMDADGKLLREETFTYDRVGQDRYSLYATTPASICGATLGQFTQINQVYFYHYLPVEETVREYDGDKVYVETQTFAYDSLGYLVETRRKTSDKRTRVTLYRRIADETADVYRWIQSINVLSPLTSKTTFVLEENGESLSTDHMTEEFVYDTLLLPGRPLLPVLKRAMVKREETVADQTEYVRFDSYGNPVYTIGNHSFHTVYIWGYRGKHIVAKIENATWQEVSSALGQAPETLSAAPEPDMAAIDVLRAELPAAHVSTYTYTPLVGMVTATDPAGQTTFYRYDKQGRLADTAIRGEHGGQQVLQSNRYHYVNQ